MLLDAAIVDVVAAAVGKGYALPDDMDRGPKDVLQMLCAPLVYP
ncbi:hypothetical protein AWT69_001947 [Pseudomonas putida]|nr:hypothetical protein AWT69_001947 [Pseudomonas putida]